MKDPSTTSRHLPGNDEGCMAIPVELGGGVDEDRAEDEEVEEADAEIDDEDVGPEG